MYSYSYIVSMKSSPFYHRIYQCRECGSKAHTGDTGLYQVINSNLHRYATDAELDAGTLDSAPCPMPGPELARTLARILSMSCRERCASSHSERKMEPSLSNSASGVSNSATRPPSMTRMRS